jgi:hypothetical protein
LTAGVDGTARTYDCAVCAPTAALVDIAEQHLAEVGRKLSADERAEFLHE